MLWFSLLRSIKEVGSASVGGSGKERPKRSGRLGSAMQKVIRALKANSELNNNITQVGYVYMYNLTNINLGTGRQRGEYKKPIN